VNIHHFILDGALWKLRDSRVAALLLHGGERTREAQGGAQGVFESVTRWLTSSAPGARGVRIATALLLFAWATLDQLHFFTGRLNQEACMRSSVLHNLTLMTAPRKCGLPARKSMPETAMRGLQLSSMRVKSARTTFRIKKRTRAG